MLSGVIGRERESRNYSYRLCKKCMSNAGIIAVTKIQLIYF